ncbi:DinB family protein [Actinomycetospora sp. CA-101289]|uniref:DinB family protein n=1 Tax=Actinomycetospora sp. CA-101289 TaxID=3239893 RepID=UPI003D994EE1
MDEAIAKAHLHRALQQGREALLWKLEGLDEYDARRPMTPTATNLLGLVKHQTFVEIGYFADTFGPSLPGGPRWEDLGDDPDADLWVTADESRDQVVATHRRVAAHTDEIIATLPLDAPGTVEHWPEERRHVTLHGILVHVVAEIHRHAGHADIVREHIDGVAGLRSDNDNLAHGDAAAWSAHHADVEQAAREAARRP